MTDDVIVARSIELLDQEGILVPADLVDRSDHAVEAFRRYAAEVWDWPDPVTNARVEGPLWWVQDSFCPTCGRRPGAWRRAMPSHPEAIHAWRVRVGVIG